MATEPAKRTRKPPPVIGRREWVSLPQLGVDTLRPSKAGPAVVAEAPILDGRSIENSGGFAEDRFVISSRIVVGPHKFNAEVTLTRRDEIGFAMLLGRQTIRRRFLVDPGRSYLIGTPPETSEDA